MVNYARLSGKWKQFLALTGFTLEEFLALLPAFQKCFQKYVEIDTLEGKKRQKRLYVDYANSPVRTIEGKLLFILIYLRKATTQDIFGEVFEMPQPVANKWIHILHACLNQAMAAVGEKPVRSAQKLELEPEKGRATFLPGWHGTAHQRPKDPEIQGIFYSGKNKRHCVKNNVPVNRKVKIILLTPTCEGTKHDRKIADETGLVLPEGSSLAQDTGFQGFAMETCCGLHNFRLNFRPWHYNADSIKPG